MNLTTTLLFYLVIGSAVAVAVHLSLEDTRRGQRWFRTLTAVVFWPLYVPALLQHPASPVARSDENDESHGPPWVAGDAADEMSAAIHQVETELDLALQSLGGWSDDVLNREAHRFKELRVAWRAQAAKIRELDQILGKLVVAQTPAHSLTTEASERVLGSLKARRINLARLQALRDRYHADLMNTLAWVRELVTMIHLAKYTGAPASRAEELVMQIATSVEGLSEVAAWRDAEGPLTLASSDVS